MSLLGKSHKVFSGVFSKVCGGNFICSCAQLYNMCEWDYVLCLMRDMLASPDLCWQQVFTQGVVVSEVFWTWSLSANCAHSGLSLYSDWTHTVHISSVGDLVHRTYCMTCPVCEDTGGCAGEGKETQHSFEELCYLKGNNHCGRKTRLKIDCSDTVDGYNSSTASGFMLVLGHTK